jgi:hypothetical protein
VRKGSSKLEKLRKDLVAAKPDWIVADKPFGAFRFARKLRTNWRPPGKPSSATWAAKELAIKDAVDWRTTGQLFQPRDQGLQCNTCTSFALAALMGDLARLNGVALISDLSPTFIHRCLADAKCGEGVDPGVAASAAMNKGIPYALPGESLYDLADCAAARAIIRIAQQKPLYNAQMAQAALQRGPIFAVMELYEDFWSFFRGGAVYRHTKGQWLAPHSIVIVGYDKPGGHWIVKNSQGISWGDAGYARVAFDECGIFTPAGNGGMEIAMTTV